jgi:hypothetical protein
MSDKDYTAKEAMEILGKPQATFYREVKAGLIPHKGKRPNMRFPKEAIDALADLGPIEEESNELSFAPITIADLWEAKEISTSPYGEENDVPFKTVMEWKKVNNDMGMSLREGNKLVGWTTFLPLDEKIAVALINNQMKEKDIAPKFVRKWTENKVSVYIPVVEVVPSGNKYKDIRRGTFLLRKTLKWAITLTIQHDIKNWYAVGATSDGQAILEALGFIKIHETEDGKEKGYVLETIARPARLIAGITRDMQEQTGLPEKARQ